MARKKRRKPVQQEISFPMHGGARPGAGRKPKGARAGVPHVPRELLSGREPLLITIKVRAGLASLRSRTVFVAIERALVAASERFGVRIIHFSVQDDHLHLVVEAISREALARAMKGLGVRIARAVNRTMKRKGAVIADRYHVRVLRSPRQTANALLYTLANARKHAVMPRGALLDPCSSAPFFDGWRGIAARASPMPRAATWLLRVGWRRYGPLCPRERPGPRP